MAASEVRMKSKKATATVKNEQRPLRRGVRIRVGELRRRDRIVTSWHDSHPRSVDEALDLLMDTNPNSGGRFVSKSHKIESIEECPGNWRTHVHINGHACWDLRSYIWVVDNGG